ncbi:HAD family hydrolase [Salsipaludibacter albus]|uniref:HAD family hydrolase n=1 Tax=Salsipaludibacter albus TaxID=2849650 RepID=UPI001EE3AF56
MASDIDGTLVRSDGTVSDRTRRAVAATEDADVLFVLVTGRPPRWLAQVTDQLDDHRGLAICANGGLVIDLHTDEVVQVDPFTPEVGREVLGRLRDLDLGLALGVEWPDGFGHDAAYPRGIRRSEQLADGVVDVHDDEAFLDRPVAKILVRPMERSPGELAATVREATDGLATVTWSSTGLLELSADGVTKATALARLAASHDVDAADLVAFGDMPNDLPMLEWAGHGVAVANAHPMVRDAADEVAPANDDDGVAVVLERLLAERT